MVCTGSYPRRRTDLSLASSLESLVAEGILGEVISRLKSGKEADVYMVRYGGEVVAAKVYKDRAHRSFKNNAIYKEGRTVRNSRSQRAIDKGSKFGKDAGETAWKATEAATLYKLHAAGVRVPTPVLFLEGVLLMEIVRGDDGEVAPRLIDVDLTAEEANAAYLDMVSQLVRILSCDLIHGDLSPYNVLWGTKGPTIIDFPQAISAAHNNSSEGLFLRDARNILDHFVAIAPALKARSGDAREIWRAYVRRELSADFMPTGRAPATPEPARVLPPRQEHAGTDDTRGGPPRQKPREPRHNHGPKPQPQRDPRYNRGPAPQPQRDPRYNRGPGPQPQRDPRYNRGPGPQLQRDPNNRGPGPQLQRDPNNRGPGPQLQRDPNKRGPGSQPQRDPRYNRGPQQQPQGGPQQHGQRGPQPRGPQQHGQRGPQPEHGQRGPKHPQQRGSQQQGPSGGNRRPRVPEVIVLSRPRRADAPPPAPSTDRAHAPAEAHPRNETTKTSTRRRVHRP